MMLRLSFQQRIQMLAEEGEVASMFTKDYPECRTYGDLVKLKKAQKAKAEAEDKAEAEENEA